MQAANKRLQKLATMAAASERPHFLVQIFQANRRRTVMLEPSCKELRQLLSMGIVRLARG